MEPDPLFFNGINGATGEYLLPPLTAQQVSAAARGEPQDPKQVAELKQWWDRISQPHFAPVEGAAPKDLAETGWGVVFAHNAGPEVKKALAPLLEHRRQQAAR